MKQSTTFVDTLGLLRCARNDKIDDCPVIAKEVKQSTCFVETLGLLRCARNDKIDDCPVIAKEVKQSLAGDNLRITSQGLQGQKQLRVHNDKKE